MNVKHLVNKLKISSTYFLFIILITLTLLVYSLDDFSSEENLKDFYVNELYKNSTIKDNAVKVYDEHKKNCIIGSTTQTLDFSDGNRTIDCEIVLNTEKEEYGDAIIEEIIFKEDYNKIYPCTFLQCLFKKETLPVVLSKQGHDFLHNTKLFLVLGTIICGLLLLVLAETLTGGLKSVGSIFFIAGVNYFFTKYLADSNPFGQQFSRNISSMSASIQNILLVLFILGTVLLLSAFIIKFVDARKKK